MSDSYEPPVVHGMTTGVAPTSVGEESSTFSSYGGAGSATLVYLMSVVMMAYAFLFSIMLYAFVCNRRSNGHSQGFVRFDMETQMQATKTPVAELDQMWRKSFISKVYGLLCMQLFVTVAISFSMMQFGGYELMKWMYTDGSWIMSTSLLGVFVTLVGLICTRHRYPLNLCLLLAFTLATSTMVGTTCTAYAARGYSTIVVEAFAITSIIFIGLTVFTMQSKWDFSFLGAGLSVALLGLIVWGFFAAFAFPSFMFSQVYALIGSLIFSLYVVYDTYIITQTLPYDEYILGAINLYLDFINLFLMILRLLGGSRE